MLRVNNVYTEGSVSIELVGFFYVGHNVLYLVRKLVVVRHFWHGTR
jgi:hypothetical protein